MINITTRVEALKRSAREIQRRVQDTHQRLIAPARPAVMPDAIPFLDPIEEIVEEHPPRFLRSTHYILVALFVVTVLTAALVRVDVVVQGTGRIATETPPVVMLAIERSIIRELPVRAGDTVRKGQVLATLDPTFAQADLGALTAQQKALQAQLTRLETELEGGELRAAPDASREEILQETLFAQRKAQYGSRLRIFDEEIERRRANIRTARDNRDSEAQQLAVAKDVESMRSQMMQKQVGSKLNFLEAQSARMRIEQNLQDTVNRLTELEHDLQSKEAERQAFMDEWRQQVLDSIIGTRTELAKIDESIAKASLIKDLVVITAPADGVILEVIKRGEGSLVREGEPLVNMIESNTKLVADITINSSDIGYTRVGDEVVVKVDAFPYQRHGFLPGRLLTVSEESFPVSGMGGTDGALPKSTSQGSGAAHRGRIELIKTELEEMPPGARLIPGMTVMAEIKVGSRSVLSYFLNPVTRVFGESIREP